MLQITLIAMTCLCTAIRRTFVGALSKLRGGPVGRTLAGRRDAAMGEVLPDGFQHIPGYFDEPAQRQLLAQLRTILSDAPLYTPQMPRTGKPLSVRMSNCGPMGWVTDKNGGYRYQEHHPVTGKPWQSIPLALLDLWIEVAPCAPPPEACLVNYYEGSARPGLASRLRVARRRRHLSHRRADPQFAQVADHTQIGRCRGPGWCFSQSLSRYRPDH